MSHQDSRLVAARRADSKAKRERAIAALRQLEDEGSRITFASVARRARISTWLTYNAPEVRQAILLAREPVRSSVSSDGADSFLASAIRTDLEHARYEIRTQRDEISRLKKALGEQFGSELSGIGASAMEQSLSDAQHQLGELAHQLSEARKECALLTRQRDNLVRDLEAARETLRRMMLNANLRE